MKIEARKSSMTSVERNRAGAELLHLQLSDCYASNQPALKPAGWVMLEQQINHSHLQLAEASLFPSFYDESTILFSFESSF